MTDTKAIASRAKGVTVTYQSNYNGDERTTANQLQTTHNSVQLDIQTTMLQHLIRKTPWLNILTGTPKDGMNVIPPPPKP